MQTAPDDRLRCGPQQINRLSPMLRSLHIGKALHRFGKALNRLIGIAVLDTVPRQLKCIPHKRRSKPHRSRCSPVQWPCQPEAAYIPAEAGRASAPAEGCPAAIGMSSHAPADRAHAGRLPLLFAFACAGGIDARIAPAPDAISVCVGRVWLYSGIPAG